MAAIWNRATDRVSRPNIFVRKLTSIKATIAPLECHWQKTSGDWKMMLLILIIVLVLLFGGGGYYGYRRNYYGRRGHSLAWIILVVLVLVVLFGHAGHPVL